MPQIDFISTLDDLEAARKAVVTLKRHFDRGWPDLHLGCISTCERVAREFESLEQSLRQMKGQEPAQFS